MPPSSQVPHPEQLRVPDWRSVVEHLDGAVVVLELDGRVVAANGVVYDFLGLGPDELIGRRAWELDAVADHAEIIQEHLRRAALVDHLEPLTLRLTAADGRQLALAWRVSFLRDEAGTTTHVLLIGVDVTGQFRLADDLRERERLFRDAFERSNTVWWELDPHTGRGVWTEAATSLYGIDAPPSQHSLELWRSVLHPDDRASDDELLRRILDERLETFEHEYRILHPELGLRWIHTHARVLHDRNGAPYRLMGIDTDVTARREAEEHLRRSELYFRTLAESLPQLVWTADADGRLDFVNMRWIDYTGVDLDGAAGSGWLGVVHDEDRDATAQAWRNSVRSGVPYGVQHRLMCSGGAGRWHVSRAMPVRDDHGAVVKWFGSSTDVHDQKRTALDLSRRTEQQTAVAELGMLASRSDELPELLRAATDRVCRVLGGDACMVSRLAPDGDELVAECVHGDLGTEQPVRMEATTATSAGAAVATGAPVTVRDAGNDARFGHAEWQARAGLAGTLDVTIPGANGPYGVLSVHTRAPRSFDTADTHFVQSIANLLGAAIERRQDDARLRLRLRQLAALHAIDTAITEGTDLAATLTVVADHVRRALGADAVGVLVHRQQLQLLEFVAGSGFRTPQSGRTRLRLGEGVAGVVALERRSAHVPDLLEAEVPFVRVGMLRQEGFVTYWGVPLVAKGELEGVLEVFSRSPQAPDQEWHEFLATLGTQTAIAINNARLFTALQASNANLRLAYEATIEGWARALDLKDHETEGHSRRVTERTVELAGRLGVPDRELVHVRRGALLHDIGKMAIPDRILLKRGALTADEWAVMRTHPTVAYELLSPIPFLREAIDIPYCHHERWDGGGYPRGLAREQIPLSARIFAVVDVYDALTSSRPYWPAWSHEQAVRHIESESGQHFDPNVVDAFLELIA